MAREVWLQVVLVEIQSIFFAGDLYKWMKLNLCSLIWLPNVGSLWASLFGIIARCIWKNKNIFIFQGITWNSVETIKSSKSNWIQLYTDGSVKMDVGVAAVREGILDYLSLISRNGYQKVMIHADHLEVGKAIQDVHLAYSSSALLRRIHMSLQVIQHWKIKNITKERNQVADRIVKMATIRSTVMQ
ncbi:hypothetical protein Godav_001093, partial [Gossypium davidsonii]|nr:hypothetical protein [Gossypium davidsonii]